MLRQSLDSPPPPTSLYVTSPQMNEHEINMRILSRMNLPYLNTGIHLGMTSAGTAFHPPGTGDTRPSI